MKELQEKKGRASQRAKRYLEVDDSIGEGGDAVLRGPQREVEARACIRMYTCMCMRVQTETHT